MLVKAGWFMRSKRSSNFNKSQIFFKHFVEDIIENFESISIKTSFLQIYLTKNLGAFNRTNALKDTAISARYLKKLVFKTVLNPLLLTGC